jgi:Putative enzyme of poly-gamma-glutamate biosynthesis (capsule formation)
LKVKIRATLFFITILCVLTLFGCADSITHPTEKLAPSETSEPQQTAAETTPITGSVVITPYVESGETKSSSETTAESSADTDSETAAETQSDTEIILPQGTTNVITAPSNTRQKLSGGRSYSFAAVGDNVVHTGIWLEAKERATSSTREYNFAPVFDDLVDMITNADISFINQETLMGGAELGYSNYPTFNSPQDIGLDLVDLGFDIVNIANNHMADKSVKGLTNTIAFWKSQPVTMIGGYENYADYQKVRTITRDGVTIALLAYTYGTNGISLPSSTELYVPYIDYAEIAAQVAVAKKVSDLVFVSIHWGVENTFTPTAEQTSLAQYMADLGVDVIIGHHPHVVQPITWLKGKNGNDTLCVYSLGNIVSLMAAPYNMVGGVMTFKITEGTDGWYIENPIFIPTVFFYGTNYYSQHIYLMKDFTDALAAKMGTKNYGYTATLDKLRGYVTSTIDAAFLPDYMK